jgi:hypothetical protein
MPTPLSRPVTRRVVTLRMEPLNVTLSAEGIIFREPRHKKGFLLPYGVAFLDAVYRHVDAERRAKAAAKKAKKKNAKGGR